MSENSVIKALQGKISPFIKKGETVISCGTFQTRISVTERSLSASFSDLANRNHIIAVTDQRLIVSSLDRTTGMPIEEEVFYVSFADIKIENDGLLICQPESEQPTKYLFVFGYKVNKDQYSNFYPGFIDAIESKRKNL
jgi:hypothetical protein